MPGRCFYAVNVLPAKTDRIARNHDSFANIAAFDLSVIQS